MSKKETTIDDLARMVQKGFENTATKDDLVEVNTRLDGMDKRFDKIDTRDHIENLLLRAHDNRIERLEDKMRVVETALEV